MRRTARPVTAAKQRRSDCRLAGIVPANHPIRLRAIIKASRAGGGTPYAILAR